MTNEGILVKLYSLIPNTWMEGAGALQEENLGLEKERERGERREGWSREELGHSCGWCNIKRERPEAGRESHFIRKMPESGDERTIRPNESQGEAVKTDVG